MNIIVVGGGVVGLFCALTLARRGAQVRLIDAADPARPPASAVAAGMLAPISEAALEPPHAHPLLLELGIESLGLWKDFLGEEGFSARGTRLAAGDAGWRQVQARARAHAERAGLQAAWEEEALLLGDERAVSAPGVLARLTLALREAGGRRRTARVRALETRHAVLDSGERVAFDAALLCPGAWAGEGLRAAAPVLAHVFPMKGVIVALAARAPSPPGRGEIVRARDVYVVTHREGPAQAGASMQPGRSDLTPEPAIAAALAAAAARAVPALAGARVTAAAGVRAMSPDWAPLIGPDGEAGVLVACGHSRNGWLLAPATAAIVADYAYGRAVSPLAQAFSPARFG